MGCLARPTPRAGKGGLTCRRRIRLERLHAPSSRFAARLLSLQEAGERSNLIAKLRDRPIPVMKARLELPLTKSQDVPAEREPLLVVGNRLFLVMLLKEHSPTSSSSACIHNASATCATDSGSR